MSRPNGVRFTLRDERSKRASPRCFSSAATRRLATDCGTRAAAAPRVKLPRSLTLTKARQAPTTSMPIHYADSASIRSLQHWTAWIVGARLNGFA
jgi:hypothetical protein